MIACSQSSLLYYDATPSYYAIMQPHERRPSHRSLDLGGFSPFCTWTSPTASIIDRPALRSPSNPLKPHAKYLKMGPRQKNKPPVASNARTLSLPTESHGADLVASSRRGAHCGPRRQAQARASSELMLIPFTPWRCFAFQVWNAHPCQSEGDAPDTQPATHNLRREPAAVDYEIALHCLPGLSLATQGNRPSGPELPFTQPPLTAYAGDRLQDDDHPRFGRSRFTHALSRVEGKQRHECATKPRQACVPALQILLPSAPHNPAVFLRDHWNRVLHPGRSAAGAVLPHPSPQDLEHQ